MADERFRNPDYKEVLRLLVGLTRKVDSLLQQEESMADALQEAFDALSAEVTTDVEAVDTNVIAAIASLQSQLQNIPVGTTLTPDLITSLTSGLTAATAAVKAAVPAPAPAPTPAVEPPAPSA